MGGRSAAGQLYGWPSFLARPAKFTRAQRGLMWDLPGGTNPRASMLLAASLLAASRPAAEFNTFEFAAAPG